MNPMPDTAANSSPIAIIGAGSWGTALAIVLARKGLEIRLLSHTPELAELLRARRENPKYLPAQALPETVAPTADLAACLAGASHILVAVPSHVLRGVARQLRPHLLPDVGLISASKGLERGTLARMTEVLAAELPQSSRLAALSGPSFALEVARGEPAALVLASTNAEFAASAQALFSTSSLRLYASSDCVGVELAAALKNVIAIAAGICAGLGLGGNTQAALIARGLAEMTRLAVALGGRPETLAGLAGLGDLVLTCSGELSRNRRLGLALAQGKSLAEGLTGLGGMVAEGVAACDAALELARRNQIELPITAQMHRVLFDGGTPRQAIEALMRRPLRPE